MISKTNRGAIVGAAISSLFVAAAGAQTAPTFKISIGVRETGSTAAIGAPSAPSNAGTIEWVNLDGPSITADGTWQQLTYNFGTDPVTAFTGNGVLDGTRGVLENIRFRNSSGTTSGITMLVDDIVNTIGGVDTVVQDFESATTGTRTTFSLPNNSGSTSAFLTGGSSSTVVEPAGGSHGGTKAAELKFQFVNSTTTNWVRLGTNAAAAANNPTIDFASGNSLKFWVNVTVPNIVVGWNTDTNGNWSDATKWAGASTTTDNIPNTSSEVARLLPTTAARTITVDSDFVINGINFNSPNAYTIQGPGKLTLTSPNNSGVDASLIVADGAQGAHRITAPIDVRTPAAPTASLRLTVTVPTGASLRADTLNTVEVAADGTTLSDGSNRVRFLKTGAGSFETAHLRFDNVTINDGTVRMTPNGTDASTSEVNSLTFAFVSGSNPLTPVGKLDIANNKLIVDYTLDATTTTSPLSGLRNRIVSGFGTGTWDGTGITSSSATDGKSAIGYGEAAAVLKLGTGATGTFGGRTVDDTAVLIAYTLKGDASLDGTVNFADLVALAQNYNGGDATNPKAWMQGDFNYDGSVNFADLVALAQNYNKTLTAAQASLVGADFAADFALAQSLVPEPTTLAATGAVAVMTLRRRRSAR